jgi:hypothetical protein
LRDNKSRGRPGIAFAWVGCMIPEHDGADHDRNRAD